VAAPPTENIDMLTTSAVKETIYRVARDVAPWFRRNKSAPAIGLLLAVPVGRWAEDMQFLLDRFPDAHFEVHMKATCAGEAEMLTSPRISVRVGGDSWRWAIGDALTTILGRRLPLVVISGRGRENQGRWLARFGLFSDPVVAPTMSDFILALRFSLEPRRELSPAERKATWDDTH
jgi:hypothetical protein